MKIEVFDDMIVIHSPDNSENNKFRGLLGFKENKYVHNFIEDLIGGLIYWEGRKTLDVNYNDEEL